MTGYPLLLDLAGRRVVVVGGGRVAARRVGALVQAGALVHVVAPALHPDLRDAGVALHERPYATGDLAGAWLVLACTGDPAVNARVAADAEAGHVWCVRADDAAASPAWTAAAARHDDLVVAVNAGGDPRRAARLRDAIAAALADGTLPTRRIRASAGSGAAGHVALVGAGPGSPGLLTVRGRALLQAADVVVTDQLVDRALLRGLADEVEVVDAGKRRHEHTLTQEEINTLLVDRARAGRRVVRLKGGDPFVFGRGGEEALACVAAGVAFEVVPGVTSAVAVPACAGIPVTHRGITQEFSVVSAHLDPSQPGSTVDWAALASGTGTLVLLMAVAHLEQVTAELVKRGRPADTPAALISSGTTDHEQVVVDRLGSLAATVRAAGVGAPAVVVVGDVVRLREQLTSG